MHYQREVHGHRMEALVDQTFGQIERRQPLGETFIAEQRFVHARSTMRVGCVKHVLEAAQNVIRIENRILGDLLQTVGAVAQDISQGAGEHAHLTMERSHTAEAVQALAEMLLGESICVLFLDEMYHPVRCPRRVRERRKWRKRFGKDHWSAARTAATVWGREGLVQVDMHRIDPEVAGPHPTDDRIEVRPVAIDEAARFVDRI